MLDGFSDGLFLPDSRRRGACQAPFNRDGVAPAGTKGAQ